MGLINYRNGVKIEHLYSDMQKGSKGAEKEAFEFFSHRHPTDFPKREFVVIDRIFQHLTGSSYQVAQACDKLAHTLWDHSGVALSLAHALAIECVVHDDVRGLKRLFELGYVIQPIVGSSTIVYFAAIYKARKCLELLVTVQPLEQLLKSGKALDHPILIDPMSKQISAMKEAQKLTLFETLVKKNSLRSARFVIAFIHPMLRGRYLSDELLRDDPEVFELIALSDPDMRGLLRHLICTEQFEAADALLTYASLSRPTLGDLLSWDIPHDDKGWIITHLLKNGQKLEKQHYLSIATLQYWNIRRILNNDGSLTVYVGSYRFDLPQQSVFEVLILAKEHDLLLQAIEKLSDTPKKRAEALRQILESFKQKHPQVDFSWIYHPTQDREHPLGDYKEAQ